ncbi:MAG: type II toxin-antitoxin system Phd/YefM family antitoxin [Streptosporangiaceae bacterium]
MTTLTISQARASLPELVTRVEEGEEVTITRHGRAVAVLVRPDVLRSRANVIIEAAERVHDLLVTAAASELPVQPGLTQERAEELLREIRAGRDSR